MATEDDKVDTGALGTVVAVGAAGMIGISLAVNALVRHEVGTISSGRDQLGEAAYHTYKEGQLNKLSAPATWADQSKGQVAIPIERAMKDVIADLRRNPWNATPSPPPDAGSADAAVEAAPDAGADGSAAETDAGAAAPEPPAPAPLSPTAPAPTASAPAAPIPSTPRVLPPPTVPPAPPPPASAPAQPAPPPPPATKP